VFVLLGLTPDRPGLCVIVIVSALRRAIPPKVMVERAMAPPWRCC
jgi:hypothetical protein